MRKNKWPRTDPCGTPALTDFHHEDWPLEKPVDIRCLKNDLISFNRLPSIPL